MIARLPSRLISSGSLSPRRQVLGLAVAVVGVALLTIVLAPIADGATIATVVLAYQLLVVVVALIGGFWPALVSALGAGILLDFFFLAPLYQITIADPLHLLDLVIFVVVAILVSVVVDRSARRSRIAIAAAEESATLAAVAGGVLRSGDPLAALVTQLRESFGMRNVTLRVGGEVLHRATADDATGADELTTMPVGPTAQLLLRGRPLVAADRQVLGAFLSQLEVALQRRELLSEAEAMRPVAEADRLRTALLAAVGHDLRRPLAAATAAVTSLRSAQVTLTEADERELLEAAEVSLQQLADLVTKLLDASRLQAGVLGVSITPVALDEVVLGALDELELAPGNVRLELADTAVAAADAVLLQRAVVNLLANALRFSPPDHPPLVSTQELADRVRLRVIDRGPGIPRDRRDEVFAAFQRLGDVDNSTGVGLGLSLSKGFVEAMGGTISVEDTPGGGLTMVIELPVHA